MASRRRGVRSFEDEQPSRSPLLSRYAKQPDARFRACWLKSPPGKMSASPANAIAVLLLLGFACLLFRKQIREFFEGSGKGPTPAAPGTVSPTSGPLARRGPSAGSPAPRSKPPAPSPAAGSKPPAPSPARVLPKSPDDCFGDDAVGIPISEQQALAAPFWTYSWNPVTQGDGVLQIVNGGTATMWIRYAGTGNSVGERMDWKPFITSASVLNGHRAHPWSGTLPGQGYGFRLCAGDYQIVPYSGSLRGLGERWGAGKTAKGVE